MMNDMDPNEQKEIIEEGVLDLNLEWPNADSIYEIRIYRAIEISGTDKSKQVSNLEEYLDFLYLIIFPLVNQLESSANIDYWHILNHGEYLDLRLLITNSDQHHKVKSVLTEHGIENEINKWGVYGDHTLGSRLGCQSLLRLYHAQSKFVQNLVMSIYWLMGRPEEDTKILITNIISHVPIYTSHTLLNIFPFDPYYEAMSHLNESIFRFQNLHEQGYLFQKAGDAINMLIDAKKDLEK